MREQRFEITGNQYRVITRIHRDYAADGAQYIHAVNILQKRYRFLFFHMWETLLREDTPMETMNDPDCPAFKNWTADAVEYIINVTEFI